MADYFTQGAVTEPIRSVPVEVRKWLALLVDDAWLDEDTFIAEMCKPENWEMVRGLARVDFLHATFPDEGGAPTNIEVDTADLESASNICIGRWDTGAFTVTLNDVDEAVLKILQWVLGSCTDPQVTSLRVAFSHSCSRPRLDGYGGGYAVITRKDFCSPLGDCEVERYERAARGEGPCAEDAINDALANNWTISTVLTLLGQFLDEHRMGPDIAAFFARKEIDDLQAEETEEDTDVSAEVRAARGEDVEEESPECPACDGLGYPLGLLGQRLHFRCRSCGCDFSVVDAP